ncbi:uncharacterized protein LOC111885033 [Lactuca sativa]|uniref:uncharacterized protein LOC111885033 n=1 Tax=Lactuca sativa TaxID=4236 RepID=UPI000CD92F92|nr:uncharacterized protein LOC111885033 [Lactuca sativa]
MVENDRLNYIWFNQPALRVAPYGDLAEAAQEGTEDASAMGNCIIILSSFTGGNHYMQHNYLDAMTLVKLFGYPDLFLTITCNPKWPEVIRFVESENLKPEDRPDVLTRIFKIKLDSLITRLREENFLGEVDGVSKNGSSTLSHMPIFRKKKSKLPNPKDIDCVIFAKLPDKELEPDFLPKTQQRKQCRENGVSLDNRYVVPYNKILLKLYQAHMNLEWCNQLGSIKYLFKYINKGLDSITASFYDTKNNKKQHKENNDRDEIVEYYNCRYISTCEACWRLFRYDIHYRTPPVERLSFHLQDKQPIVFKPSQRVTNVVSKPTIVASQFLAWMECNMFGINQIKYGQKGPICYEDIRTVNRAIYDSYKDVCYAIGLLDDDSGYISSIQETNHWVTASFYRSLFVMLITSDSLSRPHHVFKKTYNCLSDDVVHVREQEINVKGNDVAALLNKASLIIWDEAPMMHHHCFKVVDRTLRDIILPLDNDKPFGGKTIVFGGDFRQILPVIQRRNHSDIVQVSLHSSRLWHECIVLRLTVNMRLQVGCPNNDFEETKSFVDWILKIGEDTIDGPNDGEVEVEFPEDAIVPSMGDHIHSIVSCIYSSFQNHLDDPLYFQDKAILVLTNEEVDAINDYMLELMKDEGKTYLSSDSL